MLAILLPPAEIRVPVTFVVMLLARGFTGPISAQIGGGSKTRAALRVVIGGALALAVTWLAGHALGASGVAL